MTMLRNLIVVIALLSGGLAVAGGSEGTLLDMLKGAIGGESPAVSPKGAVASAPARRVPFSQSEIQLSFAPLVAETAPAVVNVYASSTAKARSPLFSDPFFERFFGGGMPPRVQSSLGSGVIVDESGLVVTNHHVIRDADQIRIAFADGREFESTIVLQDESIDLAVLKINPPDDLAIVELGDSDRLEVGDLVLAIGNPYGVGQTTTSGIVSALARTHIGISDFGFFIQTDAAINPGNSGGALIDMSGHLVGINTAIFSRSGGSNGIGFAIPSNMLRSVIDAAREGKEFVDRPWIGVEFGTVTAQIADALGMARPGGALVVEVTEGSAAAEAGVQPGDVVLSMDGIAIDTPDAIGYRIATRKIGETATLQLLQRGRERTIELALTGAPEGTDAKPVAIGGRGPFAGAMAAELSPRLARRLRINENMRGVAIIEVTRNSPAQRVGLRTGDVVRELNGTEITSAAQLADLAQAETRWWQFSILRDGQLLRQTLRY